MILWFYDRVIFSTDLPPSSSHRYLLTFSVGCCSQSCWSDPPSRFFSFYEQVKEKHAVHLQKHRHDSASECPLRLLCSQKKAITVSINSHTHTQRNTQLKWVTTIWSCSGEGDNNSVTGCKLLGQKKSHHLDLSQQIGENIPSDNYCSH